MSKKKKKGQVEEPPKQETEAVVEEPPVEEQAVETAAEWKEKYLRTLAEIDNMRKRTERERTQVRRYALEDFLRGLLPMLDTLQYALCAEGDADAIREGVELAINDARRILGEHGLEPIEALHQPFDPRWHEAVGMRPDDEVAPNTVIEVERCGYRLHDRVLRPSRVHISMAMPQPVQETEPDSESEVEPEPDTEAGEKA